jgi:hypothetical protein
MINEGNRKQAVASMVKQGKTRSGGMMLARCDAGTAEPRMIGFSNKSISSRKFPAGSQRVQRIWKACRMPEVGEIRL